MVVGWFVNQNKQEQGGAERSRNERRHLPLLFRPIVTAPRRIVIVGLGNYTHPLTKHSIGQVLLKNLALKAASIPRATGSPQLQLTKNSSSSKSLFGGSSSSWVTKITIPASSPPSSTTARTTTTSGGRVEEQEPLEILFVLPKALMNVCGKTIVDSIRGFLPPTPPPSSSSTPSDVPPSSSEKPSKNSKPSLKPIPKLLILSDALDTPSLQFRTQRSGGPRGHNGVRSLISALGGSREFHRFWVGIGRPPNERERGDGVARWVLGPLGREEIEACEWDEEKGRGGETLEAAWREVLRIAYEEE
ncbi:aminoacyl-tRNA hydrolase [Sporobolomyces salmoneus]|uniref:aminoacyl-tRNA hydrolase n=1 Tax=Sporobolomyces salmoneus TaxID=183962 RepID=UPI0031805702